jgi:hypothetical protein
MPFLILTLLLCSCSPRDTETDTQLPRYSDMGAAADAGQVK